MFEGYLELHRAAAVRFEHPALDAPLENIPALYQLWGILHVINAVIEVGTGLGFKVVRQALVRRDALGLFVQILPAGRAALELRHSASRTSITLMHEQSFSRSSHLRSITYVQRPDVVIEVTDNEGTSRLILFDPKYKLDSEYLGSVTDTLGDALEEAEGSPDELAGQPKKIDVDKMHAYRDAIRNSAGDRVVDYAAIMYPGPTVEYGAGIGALSAYPGASHPLEAQLRLILHRHFAQCLVRERVSEAELDTRPNIG